MLARIVAATILLATKVLASPFVKHQGDDPAKFTMDGLDCRQPVSVQSGLLKSLCTEGQEDTSTGPEEVLILQRTNVRLLDAVRCEKRITRLRQVCGSFSHSKILEPLDVMVEIPIPPEECQRAVERLVYVKEDGQSLQIDLNRKYNYKYIEHGKLTLSVDNVACQGSKILIHGEEHSSIVSLVTAEVSFKTVSLEMKLDLQQVVDLDSHVKLPIECARNGYCVDGSTSYTIKHTLNECNLRVIRKLQMTQVRVMTKDGLQKALVSHEHKVLLLVHEPENAGRGCEPLYSCYQTNYQDIKVVTGANTDLAINAVGKHLAASDVDIDLEVRTSEEYLSYHFEKLIKDKLTSVGQKLCSLNQHGLIQTEISPFHKNSLLRIMGDIVQELECTPVKLQVRLGERRNGNCNSNALPAWLQTEPVWVSSLNHLIVDVTALDAVPCTSIYVPIFSMNNGKLVHAVPEIVEVDIPITHIGEGYLHLLDKDPIVHQEYGKSLMYTSDEIKRFNSLIHFEATKSKVIDALTAKYCSSSDCGQYKPDPGASTFDISNLEDRVISEIDIWDQILEKLQEYGNYASLIVLLYIVGTIVSQLFTVVSLRCRQQIPIGLACRYTFQLNRQIRNALIVQPERVAPNQVRRTSNRGLPQTPHVEEYINMDESNVQQLPRSNEVIQYNALVPRSGQDLWY